MPRTSKRVLTGKRYPLNMRTTKELRDKIEGAAILSGRSLVQEVEFRLERSFQQQEIEKELMARLDVARDEIIKRMHHEMQEWGDEMRREMGLPEKDYDDLARSADSPEDTSKQTVTEKKEDPE
jgi:hypothetical protein